MRIGVQIPSFSYPGGDQGIPDTLKEVTKIIDAGGFSSLWVMDHYYQIKGLFDLPHTAPMLESYSTLNFFAGITKNVKLGSLVTGIIYRNPVLLLKQMTTLDVLSNGRGYFGIGAAWYKEEAEAYGFPFPSVKTRFEMLEETLQLTHKLWSDDNSSFEGKYYQIKDTYLSPQPISKPHPPIMIGGMGEKKTLRMVAQYADATNLFMRAGVEVLDSKLKILKQHCEGLGRNYSDIEKTALGTANLIAGQTPNEIIDLLKKLSEIGIEHAIFNIPGIHEIRPLETLRDEILPAVRDL